VVGTTRHEDPVALNPVHRLAHDAIGYNYRLPNINAALGVAQMENIEQKLQSKRLVAQKYFDFFAEMGIPTIKEIPETRSNF